MKTITPAGTPTIGRKRALLLSSSALRGSLAALPSALYFEQAMRQLAAWDRDTRAVMMAQARGDIPFNADVTMTAAGVDAFRRTNVFIQRGKT